MVLNPSKRLFFILLSSIFAGEFLIMLAFEWWLPSMSLALSSLVDATFLVIITAPLLYYFLVKPVSDLVLNLQRAKDELRILAQAFKSGEAIVITDAKQHILRVNQAFEAITGFEESDIIGKSVSQISSKQHNQKFQDEVSPALLINRVWSGESIGLKKSNLEFPIQVSVSLVVDAHEKLIQYVLIFSDITDRKEAENKVFRLAFFDSVTKLPNRHMLIKDLENGILKSETSKEYGALLVLESDNFDFLTETGKFLEHDVFLEKITLELSTRIPSCHVVYKTRGNEFAVLLADIGKDSKTASKNIKKITEIINSIFSTPLLIAKRKHYASVSIGVTLFLGCQFTAGDILDSANIAFHNALHVEGNSLIFYNEKHAKEIKEKLYLEHQLHGAISNNELELYFQLQVDGQRKPKGAEALARWHHPELGLISPLVFIPIAEKSLLIEKIGDHLLELAFKELIEWGKYDDTRHLTLSVNVTAKQFYRPQFTLKIYELFKKYPINPQKLTLELTESISVANLEYVSKKMFNLKEDLHINLSLDDYGTGYSSLGYLQKMPFNEIKIDQQFVKNIITNKNDASLVESIIALAKIYNFEVVAEGVETEGQFNRLRDIGCQIFQGYLFSQPVTSVEFTRLLRTEVQEYI